MLTARFQVTHATIFALSLLTVDIVRRCAADEPIATIAVVSNPYITTLPPEQIKDENGSVVMYGLETTAIVATGSSAAQRRTTPTASCARLNATIVVQRNNGGLAADSLMFLLFGGGTMVRIEGESRWN